MIPETFNNIWNSLDPKPHQRPYDFIWVVSKAEETKPKIIIETGLANGGSLKYWEHILLENNKDNYKDCLLISIDMNYDALPTWDWKNSKIDIKLVYGDSTNIDTVKAVKDILGERKIDFLYIDGGHLYGVPEKDFNNYGEFVRDNGIILVADLGEPCASETFLQLPEPKEVDPTIGQGSWKKTSNFKVKECNNQGERDEAIYAKVLNMYRR